MSRAERDNDEGRVKAIWKATAERNHHPLDIDDLEKLVAGTPEIVRRRYDAVQEYAQKFFDLQRARLHDWTSGTRKNSVADEVTHGEDSMDSASFGPDPRWVAQVNGLRLAVTDRSYGRGELDFSAPVQTAQPGLGDFQWAQGAELMDLNRPGALEAALVPRTPVDIFLKAKKVLATADVRWPSDMAPAATRPTKMVGPLK